jgi:hypothetical protein
MISAAAELARRLARDAETVCRHYLSKGRRSGRYWIVGDLQNTPGRSLYVRLQGPDHGPGAAGKWTDAAHPTADVAVTPKSPRNRAESGSSDAARRLFRAGTRYEARPPKPICAHAASPVRSTGLPCGFIRRSITAAAKMRP